MWTDTVDVEGLAAAPAGVAAVRELSQTTVLGNPLSGFDEEQVGSAALRDGRIGVEGRLPCGRMVFANRAKIEWFCASRLRSDGRRWRVPVARRGGGLGCVHEVSPLGNC